MVIRIDSKGTAATTHLAVIFSPDTNTYMLLTADTFLQVTESLRSDGTGNTHEQRKNPRVGIRLSATGMGLLTTEPFLKMGQSFILLLPAGGEMSRRAMLCKVKRFNPLSSNLFSVGASFEREINADSLPAEASATTAAPVGKGVDAAAVQDLEARLRRITAA